MIILGIETSTEVCSVGIVSESGSLVERSLKESHIHSEKLQTMVGEVLHEASLHVHDIDAVAVSIGPGSFTGLRIGLSTAKGLCFALEKPLIAISTFEAAAFSAARSRPPLERCVVVVDAKQSEYYIGVYRMLGSLVETENPVVIKPLEAVQETIARLGKALVLTDAGDRIGASAASHIEKVEAYCSGTSVATLGIPRYVAREFSDIATTEPVYLKDFVVRTQPMQHVS